MRKQIRVKYLPFLTAMTDRASFEPRPFLLCPFCFSHYSADQGDYFLADPEMVLKCCGEPSRLVTVKIMYKDYPVQKRKTK